MAILRYVVLIIALCVVPCQADVCVEWRRVCQDLNAARIERVRNHPELLLNSNPYQTPLRAGVGMRDLFFNTIDQGARDIRQMQIRDAQLVMAELVKLGINQVSMAGLQALFLGSSSSYAAHLLTRQKYRIHPVP